MTYSKDPDSDAGHELLKLDSRGRVQISPERRAALLKEFDRLSGPAFLDSSQKSMSPAARSSEGKRI